MKETKIWRTGTVWAAAELIFYIKKIVLNYIYIILYVGIEIIFLKKYYLNIFLIKK